MLDPNDQNAATADPNADSPAPPAECLGPRCAAMILEWLQRQAGQAAPQPPLPIPISAPAPSMPASASASSAPMRQGTLWAPSGYSEESAIIRNSAELHASFEHLEYALYRRYSNHLTRGERLRLENTIQNALFKIERYAARLPVDNEDRLQAERQATILRADFQRRADEADRLRRQARRAELKLAQLDSLTPEGFEEFVGELFEALGFQVEQVGGSGDQGVDLQLKRAGLAAIVQCKYYKAKGKALIGSPEAQKFLGAIHRTKSHRGYFVTTTGFTLAAEKLAADQPMELIDGPRLVELVQDAIGPGASRETEPSWF